jgi:hypothetical protein
LLSALSTRPNRASMFFKDEVSGFFESMARKEYLAGMQETLTALYDVPPVFTRRLRKETIIIESPAFIFLGGGVPDKIFAAIDESFVYSGFLPRFLVVDGRVEVDDRRPMGPPTEQNLKTRQTIVNKLADLTEIYSGSIVQKIGGEQVMVPKRYPARLTDDAWKLNAEFEVRMLKAADASVMRSLALPTFDRLSRSLLKIGVILGAVRQQPNLAKSDQTVLIEESDIRNAAWFIQQWGQNSINLLMNAGKSANEKFIESIYDFIRMTPGALRSVIMRRFHLNSKDASLMLSTLEERGMIRTERRGKASQYWIT